MNRILVILIFSSLFIFNCKPKEAEDNTKALPADFETFFEKFHSDSLYQLKHINFPLEGAKKATGNNIDLMIPVKWYEEDWTLHRPFNDHSGTFERKFYMVGPAVIEKIKDKNQFFEMERRFSKMDEEWQLIYYSVSN